MQKLKINWNTIMFGLKRIWYKFMDRKKSGICKHVYDLETCGSKTLILNSHFLPIRKM